jgi:hypothetical protein
MRAYFCWQVGTGSHYEAQTGLKLEILLPQFSQLWDDIHVPQLV